MAKLELIPTFHRKVSDENFHGRAYQESFLEMRNGLYLDFPAVVGIETLALCNATCNFCPYPGMERKNDRMPDAVLEKILRELEEVSPRPSFHINLSRVNEPFLDTRVLDISAEVERRLPEASHMFFSNGTPLTEKTLLQLSSLKKVDFLNISMNDHRQENYEAVMGLSFERTIRRINLIHEMKSGGQLPFKIFLTRVGDGSGFDAQFLEWVQVNYPAFSGIVTVRSNWMGAVDTLVGFAPNVGCRQWFQLHLLANGKEAFCCIDSNGTYGRGNAESHHVIHEIYNRRDRRQLRCEALSRLTIPQCASCSMLA
jgi:hypothetical protein